MSVLRTKQNLIIFAVVIGVNSIAFFLIDLLFPQLKDPLSSSDQILDKFTAFLFLCGFLVGIVNLLRIKFHSRKLTYIAIPLFGLLGFLEETSYKNMWFKTPSLKVIGVDIDSFHDFLSLFYKVLGTYLLIPIVFVIWYLWKRFGRNVRKFVEKHPAYYYILASAFFLFCSAVILDLSIVYHPVMEEVFEMNAAISILFAAFSISKLATFDPKKVRE